MKAESEVPIVDAEPVVFRTKVDAWLAGVVIMALAASLWTTVLALEVKPAVDWMVVMALVGLILLVVAFGIPIRDTITDRLGITYHPERGSVTVLISPTEQDSFLRLLLERGGLRPSGSELIRT